MLNLITMKSMVLDLVDQLCIKKRACSLSFSALLSIQFASTVWMDTAKKYQGNFPTEEEETSLINKNM